jgi:hypothetical protein
LQRVFFKIIGEFFAAVESGRGNLEQDDPPSLRFGAARKEPEQEEDCDGMK